jgi:hypothetical protein
MCHQVMLSTFGLAQAKQNGEHFADIITETKDVQ